MNYREKNVKNTNIWRLNNMLLNNQEITKEIKEEIKKYLETNDNKNKMIQNLRQWSIVMTRSRNIAMTRFLEHCGERVWSIVITGDKEHCDDMGRELCDET